MVQPIKIQVSQADLNRTVWALRNIEGGAEKAIMRAVNKALTGVKTDMARQTAKELSLTQKRIKKDIKIEKASKTTLAGKVTSEGRPVNLYQFKAKQKKKGVSVKVLKSGGRKTIPGAFIFIGRGKSGKGTQQLVGWRDKTSRNAQYIGTKKKDPDVRYGALPRKYRKPVESLYGPRIQDITGKDSVIRVIEEKAGDRMQKELSHQTERLLDKQK